MNVRKKILRRNGEKVIENLRQLCDELLRCFKSSKNRDEIISWRANGLDGTRSINFISKNFFTSSIIARILRFLFLSFRRVLNVICSFLGNSPASVF